MTDRDEAEIEASRAPLMDHLIELRGRLVTCVVAFGLAFVLNRTFNFHSHAPMGRQAVVYAVVVLVNYLAFILGVGSGLVALGVEYHLARLVAGACEAVYMYSAMRWIVFRRKRSAEPVAVGS